MSWVFSAFKEWIKQNTCIWKFNQLDKAGLRHKAVSKYSGVQRPKQSRRMVREEMDL